MSEDTTVRVSRNLAKFLECIKVTLDSDSLEDTIWQLIKLALPLDPEIEAIVVKLAVKRGIKIKIAETIEAQVEPLSLVVPVSIEIPVEMYQGEQHERN